MHDNWDEVSVQIQAATKCGTVLYGHQYFYSGLFFLDKKGFLLSNLPNKPYFSLSLYLYYCNFNI